MAKQRNEPPAPGTFRPRPPEDNGEVLFLVAVAARSACARPEALAQISAALGEALRGLTPPEAVTAADCLRLWQSLTRTLSRLPAERWPLAGQALLDDLEAFGQRLELMPLVSWDRLPESLDAAEPAARGKRERTARQPARPKRRRSDDPLEIARQTQALLVALPREELAHVLAEAVQSGTIDRGQATLLVRWCAKGEAVSRDEVAALDALVKASQVVDP